MRLLTLLLAVPLFSQTLTIVPDRKSAPVGTTIKLSFVLDPEGHRISGFTYKLNFEPYAHVYLETVPKFTGSDLLTAKRASCAEPPPNETGNPPSFGLCFIEQSLGLRSVLPAGVIVTQQFQPHQPFKSDTVTVSLSRCSATALDGVEVPLKCPDTVIVAIESKR